MNRGLRRRILTSYGIATALTVWWCLPAAQSVCRGSAKREKLVWKWLSSDGAGTRPMP